jgi:hypothetical protein
MDNGPISRTGQNPSCPAPPDLWSPPHLPLGPHLCTGGCRRVWRISHQRCRPITKMDLPSLTCSQRPLVSHCCLLPTSQSTFGLHYLQAGILHESGGVGWADGPHASSSVSCTDSNCPHPIYCSHFIAVPEANLYGWFFCGRTSSTRHANPVASYSGFQPCSGHHGRVSPTSSWITSAGPPNRYSHRKCFRCILPRTSSGHLGLDPYCRNHSTQSILGLLFSDYESHPISFSLGTGGRSPSARVTSTWY